MGVAKSQAILAAAVDGSRDDGLGGSRFADFQIGAADDAKQVGFRVASRISSDGVGRGATTAAENPATVVVVRIAGRAGHHRPVSTHHASADLHRGQASTFLAILRLIHNVGSAHYFRRSVIRIWMIGIGWVGIDISAHVAQLSAAVDAALDDAVGHVHRGVAQHQGCLFVRVIAEATAINRALNGTLSHIHLGVFLRLSYFAAAIDVANHFVGAADVDVHLSLAGRGKPADSISGEQLPRATAGAKDVAAVDAIGNCFADGAAVDGHRAF